MQEELEQRTVSVTVQAAKLSGRVLKAAIAATLRKMEQERNTMKVGRNTMKRLAGRDGGMNTIEVSGRMQATLDASRNATEKPSLTGALKEKAEQVKAQPAKSAGKNEQSL